MDLSGSNKENFRYVSHNQDERPQLVELLRGNTNQTNKFVCKIMLIYGIIVCLWMLLITINWNDSSKYILIVLGIAAAILIVSHIVIKKYEYNIKFLREIQLGIILLASLMVRICLPSQALLIFILPIIICCRYYDEQFTISISAIAILVGIISIIITAFVDIGQGYIQTSLVTIDEPFMMGVSGNVGRSVINSTAFNRGEYISRVILFNSINFIIIMIPLSFVCYRVTNNGKRLILEFSLMQREKDNAVHEVQESKMETMISQIQPHFLYNALNSIYYLVDKDAKKAKQAIADFSDYLRANLNFSKDSGLVPFTQELEHIKKYLSLEKLRFEEDLNIEYDIKTTTFRIPTLTLQPLVENAVKHGISKKSGGGTLFISTKEEHDNYLITIRDNGVGFDQYKKKDDNRRHIGLENSRYRLRTLCNASIDVNSEIGVGTTIKIRVPKEFYYEDSSSR